MALFNNGIPPAMKGIKILVTQNGKLVYDIVQIGTIFDGSPEAGFPERVVMPVYSYTNLLGQQPTIITTYGTLEYGKPVTHDIMTPPYLEISDPGIGAFAIEIGGIGSYGSEYNGYLGSGGTSGVIKELGLPKSSSPTVIANAEASLITRVGASMMKAASDPQTNQGKIAAYLMLPQDDPRGKETILDIPQAGVVTVNTSGLPTP